MRMDVTYFGFPAWVFAKLTCTLLGVDPEVVERLNYEFFYAIKSLE